MANILLEITSRFKNKKNHSKNFDPGEGLDVLD
jgi:hypothetical protein